MKTWTYEGYWNAVLGYGNARDIVREHGLELGRVRRWVEDADDRAFQVSGHYWYPSEWRHHRDQAVLEIELVIAEAVTDEQVEALRVLAAKSGDAMLVALCNLALGDTLWSDSAWLSSYTSLDVGERLRLTRKKPLDARRDCAWAISDSERVRRDCAWATVKREAGQ